MEVSYHDFHYYFCELYSRRTTMQSEEKINEINQHSAILEKKVENIAKKEGYITYDITKRTMVSDSGGGYMGLIYIYDLKGKTEHGDKETNIFIKRIVYSKIKLLFEVDKIYKREFYLYTDFMKQMYDLQEKENIPITDRYKVAEVFEESDAKTIVLENLTSKGFKSWYRMDPVSLDFAELAVKQLARFYGLAIALESKRPEYFDTKINNLDCVYIYDEYFEAFAQSMCMFVTTYLSEDLREQLLPKLLDVLKKYPSYKNDTSGFRTLCHGDFRHSNILFKEIDGKPSEVIAVDYQMIYHGNPVLDLIYFIFWGTDCQFRRNHLEHIKLLYHQHLANFLQHFSISVEKVFPMKEFERQFQGKLDYGLMTSVLLLPFQFSVDVDPTKLDEAEKKFRENDFEFDDRFIERFRGIVEDFIEWGYL